MSDTYSNIKWQTDELRRIANRLDEIDNKDVIKEEKKKACICVCDAAEFEFNLNNYIKFKPTELGIIVFKAHWMPYCEPDKPRELEVDSEGWSKMQLHSFMLIFGPSMGGGSNIPVNTNVIFVKG